jgi:hypothetical protein
MVASRCPQRLDLRAAAIRRSISCSVRYSRVRTEELTVFGAHSRNSDSSPVPFRFKARRFRS